jgi:predicted metal-dependent HD superfamily phosphohydrolase
MLKEVFLTLVYKYCDDNIVVNDLWNEIEHCHCKKKRHYHTLLHLENVLTKLEAVKQYIEDWDTILFSLFYHDIIYSSLKNDNEERSALLAEKRMMQLGVSSISIDRCIIQIIATKKHLQDKDSDTNYFTDADLSILGADWETYYKYLNDVRKEYAIYPNLIYNPGRKKVLQHFLGLERIYKTDYFFAKLENNARLNLQREIELL